MLMSHLEEPKLSDDEEPPTEQDKRKKLVRQKYTCTLKAAEYTDIPTSTQIYWKHL